MSIKRRLVLSPTATLVHLPLDKARELFADELRGARTFGHKAALYAQFVGRNHKIIASGETCRHSRFTPGNIILSSVGETAAILIRCGIRPELIRAGVLYWDVLEVAKPSCGTDFGLGGDDDVKILAKEGLLEWRNVSLAPEGKSLGDVFSESFLTVAEVHILQPTTLGQDVADRTTVLGDSLPLAQLPSRALSVQSLQIYGKFPVPAPSEPIEKVIEWRAKRIDDLIQFREAISEIESAIAHDDQGRLQSALRDFDNNLAVVKRTLNEGKIRQFAATHRLGFTLPEWPSAILQAGLSALADFFATGGVSLGVWLISQALSCIKIEKNELGKLARAYRYLIDAERTWGEQADA